MAVVTLANETDWPGWRIAARTLRQADVPPDEIRWRVGEGDLFEEQPTANADSAPLAEPPRSFTTPRAFVSLAEEVVCHRSPERFDLLYRLLWRLREEPGLIGLRTDPEVARALDMAKAVSRASHKMKAFVRFRRVRGVTPETFVAWFEPPHRVLQRTADFFARRFANGRFSILTPDISCHWDGREMLFVPGGTVGDAPSEDALEAFWLTYYASIFNPARLKVQAMQSEMPKRYWRNLPEAALIPQLVETARTRMDSMVESDPTSPNRRLPIRAQADAPASVPSNAPLNSPAVAAAVRACRRCDLWRDATQAVPAEGPATAAMMLVGEQPGDLEDLAGRPFVGPAGQMLERALSQAGLDRGQLYVTNAVKHFKHELRGKRRLHKTPATQEITACRWWLDHERRIVSPKVIVALGGSAALAVFGRPMPILKSRGKALPLEDGALGMITVHPSYLLRLPDERAKAEAFAGFVEDLAAARALLG